MKRFILILIAVVSILGCCKEKPDTPVTPEEPKETTYTIDVTEIKPYLLDLFEEQGIVYISIDVYERTESDNHIVNHPYDIFKTSDNDIKTFTPQEKTDHIYVLITYKVYHLDHITTYTGNRWFSADFPIEKDKDNYFKLTKDMQHQENEPWIN